MKKVLIFAGIGVVGVALAAVLVPWGLVATQPIPDAPTPPPPPAAQQARPDEAPAFTRDRSTEGAAAETTQPAGLPPGATPGDSESAAPRRQSSTDVRLAEAREAARERRNRPDIQLARTSSTQWQAALQRMSTKPKDPAAERTMERVRDLRQNLQEYRRDPSTHNFNELMAEQENIFNEFRQTTYWDQDMERMESNLNGSWEKHLQDTGEQHPYR
ncbi:MAG: hypothetical protein EA397_10510 [Deltaproteobacteria bacterium]|nr:MAG: hypothetical protein EA397_10510 [Deltaproteobacteria bacterium]